MVGRILRLHARPDGGRPRPEGDRPIFPIGNLDSKPKFVGFRPTNVLNVHCRFTCSRDVCFK